MSLVRPLLIEVISNFSVLDEPSNTSMIRYYETLAKNHMDQYLNLLMKKVQNPTTQCSKIRKKVQFQKYKNTLFAFSKMAKNQFLHQKKVRKLHFW